MRGIWPGALLVCYLALTGVVLLVGARRVPFAGIALHFALLGAIAAATWLAVPSWVRRWAPLAALLLLYSELPLVIQAAGHTELFDPRVAEWERLLFGGQPAREWAERQPSRVVSEILHGAYLSYYPIIFAVPVALHATGRTRDFSEAVFVLMLTFVVCFGWYVCFPVAGPRYLWPAVAVPDGPLRALTIWLLEARSSRGTAFPSSHVAVALTQSILAVRYFGRRGAPIAVLSAGLALGAVYGGFHYAVDVIAGVVVGAAAPGAGLALFRDRQAKAIAPT